ncbi:armadillo repeat-containing protein 6 [Pseudoscourfieldia marina]
MPVVNNTNHTLSKGKRPLAVDEDDGGLAESSKKKKRSKSAAHVHEEGNADADDDESSETTRTSLVCETLLNMSSKPVDNIDERDGVEAVVVAMKKHVHNADVKHQACQRTAFHNSKYQGAPALLAQLEAFRRRQNEQLERCERNKTRKVNKPCRLRKK